MSVGSEMEKRERHGDGGDMRKTTHGWTVVHSLNFILVTFPTFHDPMAPYLPSPWPLGTSLSAFAQVVPSPDAQGPSAFRKQYVSPPLDVSRLSPHAPTHPNTPPPPAVPSPCSSALVLGVNTASVVWHNLTNSAMATTSPLDAERHGPWCCLLVRVLHASTDRGASSWRQ